MARGAFERKFCLKKRPNLAQKANKLLFCPLCEPGPANHRLLRCAIRRRYDRALNKWRCNRTYVYRIVNGSQIRLYNLTQQRRNTDPTLRRNAFNRGALSNAKANRHRLMLRFGVARHVENLATARVNRKRRAWRAAIMQK